MCVRETSRAEAQSAVYARDCSHVHADVRLSLHLLQGRSVAKALQSYMEVCCVIMELCTENLNTTI